MSGTIPTITVGSIVVTASVTKKPIYFVRVGGQDLVIKGEGGNMFAEDKAISINWGSKLMKNVNNKLVNTKVLTSDEFNHFAAAARQKFPDPNSTEFIYLDDNTRVWTKMPFVQGLSDSDVYGTGDKRYIPDAKKIKKLILKFNDPGIWTELGKIVAADIFNHNNDRFDSMTGAWNNMANILFLENGDTKLIGLDTFDPASAMKMGQPQTDEKKLLRLRTLVDGPQRMRFCKAGVLDVGETLASKLRGVSSVSIKIANTFGNDDEMTIWTVSPKDLQTLYLPFASVYAAGLERGAGELKSYLQRKVRQYRLAPRGNVLPNQVNAPLLNQAPPQRSRNPVLPVRPNTQVHLGKPDGLPQGIWDQMVYLGWQV